MKKQKLKYRKMNKKGLIPQLVVILLAIVGGYFLLKYFGVI